MTTDENNVDAMVIVKAALAVNDPLTELGKIGYSVAEIAAWLDVGERAVRKWRDGTSVPTPHRKRQLQQLIMWHGSQMKAADRTLLWRLGRGGAVPQNGNELDDFLTNPENQQYAEKQRQLLAEAVRNAYWHLEDTGQLAGPSQGRPTISH